MSKLWGGIFIKKGDKIIIVIVLIIGITMGGYLFYVSQPVENGYIVINVDGTITDRISVFTDSEEKVYHEFTFGEHDEHVGVLEIVGNRVRMLPMEREICPEGICSDTGWISRMFQYIVCMPNRIHVYLELESSI